MKNFERKTGSLFAFGAKVTGGIFAIIGGLAFLGGFYPAIVVLLIGLFVCFTKSGLVIDFENKKYKNYWHIFGIKKGEWKKLPLLNRVTVLPFSKKFVNNLTMGGAASTSKESSFRVYLKGSESTISILASDGNKIKALEDAQLLGDMLHLNILDCTGKEKKLIKTVEA